MWWIELGGYVALMAILVAGCVFGLLARASLSMDDIFRE